MASNWLPASRWPGYHGVSPPSVAAKKVDGFLGTMKASHNSSPISSRTDAGPPSANTGARRPAAREAITVALASAAPVNKYESWQSNSRGSPSQITSSLSPSPTLSLSPKRFRVHVHTRLRAHIRVIICVTHFSIAVNEFCQCFCILITRRR